MIKMLHNMSIIVNTINSTVKFIYPALTSQELRQIKLKTFPCWKNEHTNSVICLSLYIFILWQVTNTQDAFHVTYNRCTLRNVWQMSVMKDSRVQLTPKFSYRVKFKLPTHSWFFNFFFEGLWIWGLFTASAKADKQKVNKLPQYKTLDEIMNIFCRQESWRVIPILALLMNCTTS